MTAFWVRPNNSKPPLTPATSSIPANFFSLPTSETHPGSPEWTSEFSISMVVQSMVRKAAGGAHL